MFSNINMSAAIKQKEKVHISLKYIKFMNENLLN